MSGTIRVLLLLAGTSRLAAQVTNDECFTAQPLGVGVTAGSSIGATQSPVTGDCAAFGAPFGADVWYVWQAPAQGIAKASFVQDGGFADFDTVLSAFIGGCTSLEQIACNDDALVSEFTLQSQISFPVQANQLVFLEVGGWDGDSGNYALSLGFTPGSAPPNDECTTALPIALGVTEGSTFFATQSPDSPPCGFGGVAADADVWFHLTAPVTGLLTASTASGGGFSDFDTILAVYGGACGNLQLLGCNDDASFTLSSEVGVLIQQGQDLWIALGGWGDASGSFGLFVSALEGGPPVNDDCAGALPVTAGEVEGLNVFASDSPVTASCALFDGFVGRDVWFAWTAPADGLFTATTTLSGGGFADFDTILGVFAGDCDGLYEIGCNDDSEGLQSLVTVPAVAGQTLLVEVGGWNGDAGEFLLNLIFAPDHATADVVLAQQKISDTQGGFEGDLSAAYVSFGIAVATPGDLDGDGTPDLVVGSPFEHLELADSGALWVLFLNPDGTVKDEKRLATGQGGLTVATGHTEFGVALAALGDLDGDGAPEVAVGAPGDDDGGIDRGAVHILTLGPDGSVLHATKVSDTVGGFNGFIFDQDGMGSSLAAPGDLDGDGLTELAVGTPGNDDGEVDAGAVWIWSLSADGSVHDWQRISNTKGLFTGILDEADAFGSGVAAPGDLDLDGVPDLAVGAIGDDDGGPERGAVWTLQMRIDSKVKANAKISSTQGGFEGLLFDGSLLGKGLVSPGDLDGDGVGDLFAGATGDGDGGPFHGAVWTFFLTPQGEVEGHAKISSKKGGFDGPLGTSAFFGEGLCSPGDLDRDGHVDLVVGNRFDDDGAQDRGALWVLFLDAANPWVMLGHPLAGTRGLPLLTGEGALTGNSKATIHLTAAPAFAPVLLVLGWSEVDLPLFGGTLVPAANIVAPLGPTSHDGTLLLEGRWPEDVPAGFEAFLQCWMPDAGAVQGWAASNGLQTVTH